MSLPARTRLGPYEILSALGAGGMGEVYRARDPRLGREVAIKVLPTAFSSDRERLTRFEQEARAAAALNHPNILAVYDLGQQDGSPYIVSELLEGQTLRDRINCGALSVRKAIEDSIQIAHGLAAAHDKGIVHRDLKPENIFVTVSGRVKILDFGLAKLTQGDPTLSGTAANPTTLLETLPGLVVGTVGYMAPEQVRAQSADHRSDIFSFGAILYEMLSGQRAFRRESGAETMTAILNESPADLPIVERHIPATLARIVHRCLEKNPAARFQAASDLAFALESVSSQSDSAAVAPTTSDRKALRSAGAAWIIAGVSLVVAAALAVPAFLYIRRAPPEPVVTRLDIVTPATSDPFSFALSPDGRSLVFTGTSEGRPHLWLRPLDQPSARPLQGTAGGSSPFWAPDNRAIAFFADGKLKRLNLEGGVPQVMANAPDGRGGSWSSAGFILFTPSAAGGVFRIAAAGGTAEAVLSPELPKYGSYRYPQLLPDNQHFIFFANVGTDPSAIFLGSLSGATPKRLVQSDTAGGFAPPNFVLRVNQGVLEASRLDLEQGVVGDPMPVAQPVGADPTVFRGAFAVSSTGVLAHRLTTAARRQLFWLDRTGAKLGVVGEPNDDNQLHPALAPDAVRVAVQRTSTGVPHTFLLDGKPQDTAARLVDDPSPEGRPVWSPDGRSVVVIQGRRGNWADGKVSRHWSRAQSVRISARAESVGLVDGRAIDPVRSCGRQDRVGLVGGVCRRRAQALPRYSSPRRSGAGNVFTESEMDRVRLERVWPVRSVQFSPFRDREAR